MRCDGDVCSFVCDAYAVSDVYSNVLMCGESVIATWRVKPSASE